MAARPFSSMIFRQSPATIRCESRQWIASAKGVPMSPANPNRAANERGVKDSHAPDAVARRIAKAGESKILVISRE